MGSTNESIVEQAEKALGLKKDSATESKDHEWVKGFDPYHQRALTFGEKAVGLSFNPSGDILVTKAKSKYADIIDFLNNLRQESGSPEVKRQLSVAITELQTSQMWAVKAITWKD